MKSAVAVAVFLVAAGAAQASSSVLAAWRFPDPTPPTSSNYTISFPIVSDVSPQPNPGRITTNATTWNGVIGTNADQQGAFQYFTGDAANALPGDTTFGAGLNIRGLSNTTSTNGRHITFQFDSSGFQDIILSMGERVTSTGPTSYELSYSSDGVNFTSFATTALTTRNSTWYTRSHDLSSIAALDNDSSAFIRLTFTGYTATTGGIRFDNIVITGVPTPGTLALLAGAGLVATRRRR